MNNELYKFCYKYSVFNKDKSDYCHTKVMDYIDYFFLYDMENEYIEFLKDFHYALNNDYDMNLKLNFHLIKNYSNNSDNTIRKDKLNSCFNHSFF